MSYGVSRMVFQRPQPALVVEQRGADALKVAAFGGALVDHRLRQHLDVLVGLRRDSPALLGTGFTVRDGNYGSARWPGDAHRFAADFAVLLG